MESLIVSSHLNILRDSMYQISHCIKSSQCIKRFPLLRLQIARSKSCQSGQCMVSYGRSHLWRSSFHHQNFFFSRHSLAASRECSKNLSRPAEEICQGDFLRRSNTCLGVSLYVSFRYYVDKCSIFIFFLFFQEGNRF